MAEAGADRSFYQEKERFPGALGWLWSTDHKRIGVVFLGALLVFFSVGVTLGVLMRTNLVSPGILFNAENYNRAFTLHGLIQIFLFIIPGIPVAFGNFFLPLLIGARDVAFPRLNRLSLWLYLSGALVILLSLFGKGGPLDTGWTFYAPFSERTGTSVSTAVAGVFLLGFSSILTGLNFVTTIHRLRAPGMGWKRMPLFPWTLYATGWVQLLATPVLALALALIALERIFGMGFFDPAKGGDPLLFEHLFWIYSHPAVYIMVLPAMGVISEIIPVFARRDIFNYLAVAYSAVGIAVAGYLVWGHHMFTSGMSDTSRVVFSFLSFLVAVPTGVKILNWVATLRKGSITRTAPMLFALSFIFLFTIGGLTGLIVASLSPNLHIHGTYFIVGHFHYVMFGGAGFAFLAGLHYWFPKMTGRMYGEKAARIGWFLLFSGFNLLYFTMFILGFDGMPRRYFDYPPRFFPLHLLSSTGSWLLGAGILILFGNLLRAAFRGPRAPADPWGGTTLEWTVPSPPPAGNFAEIPTVTKRPYLYQGGTGE